MVAEGPGSGTSAFLRGGYLRLSRHRFSQLGKQGFGEKVVGEGDGTLGTPRLSVTNTVRHLLHGRQ